MRIALNDKLDPANVDGIISMHLIENDPALSKPLAPKSRATDPGAGDWYVLIDGTNIARDRVRHRGASIGARSNPP